MPPLPSPPASPRPSFASSSSSKPGPSKRRQSEPLISLQSNAEGPMDVDSAGSQAGPSRRKASGGPRAKVPAHASRIPRPSSAAGIDRATGARSPGAAGRARRQQQLQAQQSSLSARMTASSSSNANVGSSSSTSAGQHASTDRPGLVSPIPIRLADSSAPRSSSPASTPGPSFRRASPFTPSATPQPLGLDDLPLPTRDEVVCLDERSRPPLKTVDSGSSRHVALRRARSATPDAPFSPGRRCISHTLPAEGVPGHARHGRPRTSEAEGHLRSVLLAMDAASSGPSSQTHEEDLANTSCVSMSSMDEDIGRWADGTSEEVPLSLLIANQQEDIARPRTARSTSPEFMPSPLSQHRRPPLDRRPSASSQMQVSSPGSLAPRLPSRPPSTSPEITSRPVALTKKRTHSTSSHFSILSTSSTALDQLHSRSRTPNVAALSIASPPPFAPVRSNTCPVPPLTLPDPLLPSRPRLDLAPALHASSNPSSAIDTPSSPFRPRKAPLQRAVSTPQVPLRSTDAGQRAFDLDMTVERCRRTDGYVSFEEVGLPTPSGEDDEEAEEPGGEREQRRGWLGWLVGIKPKP